MTHNEEVPDFLGGLGNMLPADVLKKVNELLEQLHRKDKDHQGSTVINIYGKGCLHVDHVDNQNFYGDACPKAKTLPDPPCVGREKEDIDTPTLPLSSELSTLEAIKQSIILLMEERYEDKLLFNRQAHWQAIYRILVDKGYCRESDFDGFDAFIRRVMPEEVNKPYKKESVKQISKTDFALPFDRWHYDPQTSTTRKPYDRMVAVTGRFKEILEQKGL
jgi:hypothetical protein